ncbi:MULTISPECIES: 2Fe-2S iron-sulfur cluster-binding protein [Paraburkholderia]|uniref:2Fe-2S iron-sulfur cluster binding domain-containing protein n=1 Tax=Paraburkholderia podalyriae TaxID=1938811 RepID=A0ABR7PXJ8_9BURK|nr:2Fe-2S iron-sulfur cluster-binding protein [Paraburkholderia podalyriae]MBC8751014.1 2Fe-2S iron-sulfur cluster binding domain-containing protein [Paraburkholderia podalyriae]
MTWRIEVENTGDTFGCPENATVLHAMAATGGRGIPLGCRGGGCGVCKVQVLSGRYHACKMSRACVSADEEARGTVLACRVSPLTDLSVRVIGRMARCIDKARARTVADEHHESIQQQQAPGGV